MEGCPNKKKRAQALIDVMHSIRQRRVAKKYGDIFIILAKDRFIERQDSENRGRESIVLDLVAQCPERRYIIRYDYGFGSMNVRSNQNLLLCGPEMFTLSWNPLQLPQTLLECYHALKLNYRALRQYLI